MTRLKLDEIPAVKFPAEGNFQMARVNLPCNFGCGRKKKKKSEKIPELYLGILMNRPMMCHFALTTKNFRLCFSLMVLGSVPTSEYNRILLLE